MVLLATTQPNWLEGVDCISLKTRGDRSGWSSWSSWRFLKKLKGFEKSMRSAISAAALAYWKSQSRHFTSTSKWGKLSLGAVKCPQPWEKLKIGVIGAPLNHGQVSFKILLLKCSSISKVKKNRERLFTF